MSKINWTQALADYIGDETLSLREIAKNYGVNESTVFDKSVVESWAQKRKDALAKAKQITSERTAETIATVTARHIQTAKILQGKGLKKIVGDPIQGIVGSDPDTFGEARQAVKDGVDIERKSYGLDKPQISPQISVNVAILNKKNYEY